MRKPGASPRAQRDAADWFARMRGPGAGRLRPEFERWRAGDPERAAAYADVEELWRATGVLAGSPLARAPLFVRRPSFFAQPGPRFAMAGIALALLVGVGTMLLSRDGDGGAPAVAAVRPVASQVGEIRRIRLPDGSVVTLDTDSAIEPAFTAGTRKVRLTQGRARFDVAHDAARPFTVEGGGMTVVARGTVFDVALASGGLEVTLLRGAVDVRDARNAAAAPLARLAPGERFAVAPQTPPRVEPAPRGGDRWVSGMLSFDGEPLGAVVEQANRYSRRKLRLETPELARLRVTGVFRALPADQLAAALAAAFNLRVREGPGGDLILVAGQGISLRR